CRGVANCLGVNVLGVIGSLHFCGIYTVVTFGISEPGSVTIDRIIVRPRTAAIAFDPDYRYLVISISDPPPEGEPAPLKKRFGILDMDRDILRLAFDDIDPTLYGPEYFDEN